MHLARTSKFSVIDLGPPPANATKAGKPTPAAKPAAKPAAAPKPATQSAVASKPAAEASGSDIDSLTAAMTKHQSELKLLKKNGASTEELAAASQIVDKLRTELAAATAKLEPTEAFPRKGTSLACIHSPTLAYLQAQSSLLPCI